MGRPRKRRDTKTSALRHNQSNGSATLSETVAIAPNLSAPACDNFTTPNLTWPDGFGPDDSLMPVCNQQIVSSSSLTSASNIAQVQVPIIQTALPKVCHCIERVQQCLADKNDTRGGASCPIAEARQAVKLARDVLYCGVCGDIRLPPSILIPNVLLLGSLLMSIVASYDEFIAEQWPRAMQLPHEASTVNIQLGGTDGDSVTEVSFNNLDYWRLLRKGLVVGLDNISTLCDSFAATQHKIHDQGHENCQRGVPCRNPNTSSLISHPANICPRSVHQTTFFNCFRTVNQIRTATEEALRKLEYDISDYISD